MFPWDFGVSQAPQNELEFPRGGNGKTEFTAVMAAAENAAAVHNRPSLRDFLISIASIKGDLSNITAPPFVLAPYSTVELPQYWGDHPELFVAPAQAQNPEERALRVLKWFLACLRNQQYAGRKPDESLKKPLNAFLGELFLGSWEDEAIGETKLVAEQVSHHPPITACYLANEKYGIRAEGFSCQEISLSTSVNIKQKGYAVLRIDQYEEEYLIPVPNIKIKNLFTGAPYPELDGKYTIVSSNGFISEMEFKGRGFIYGGTKNSVKGRLFHTSDPFTNLYTAEGSWISAIVFRDATGTIIDTYNAETERSHPITVADLSEQHSWESRRAWANVRDAILKGDMRRIVSEKSIIEHAQRRMRKEEAASGMEWERLFFQRIEEDPVFEELSKISKVGYSIDFAHGLWKADRLAIGRMRSPYRGDLGPTGLSTDAGGTNIRHDQEDMSDSSDMSITTSPRESEEELDIPKRVLIS